MALVVVICVGIGCSGNGGTLRIDSSSLGKGVPTYITHLDCAPIDDRRLGLLWVDEFGNTNRLWTAVVEAHGNGLSLATPATLVVSGRLQDANLVPNHDSYDIVYTRSRQLFYRNQLNSTDVALTLPVQQSVIASSACTDSIGNIIASAIVINLHGNTYGGRGPAVECMIYVITPDTIVSGSLATVELPANRGQQPSPVMRGTREGATVAFYIRGGRISHLSVRADGDSAEPNGAGEYLVTQVSVGDAHTIAVTKCSRLPLPVADNLTFTTNYAAFGQELKSLVTAGPAQHAFRVGLDGGSVQRLSSLQGAGSTFGTPTVQALSMAGGSTLVAWVDTKRQANRFTAMSVRGLDPTLYGGDIEARLLTEDGAVVANAVNGFPVRTDAQCLRLIRFGGRAVAAWAGATTNVLLPIAPRPDKIYVSLLDRSLDR